ncbi:hypothetical protein ACFVHS_41775 [Streptomyces sp. NPDC057746]|uniref:hypothetical protein n=1 Tax=Streptomyces sp. NPDC057746 TaxID=3346237 RepID=UPI0036C1B532
MIATTPVARWAWGRDDETADVLVRCLTHLLTAYAVLATHRLAEGEPVVRVAVTEARVSNSRLFDGELDAATEVRDPAKTTSVVAHLTEKVRTGLRPGEIGAMTASTKWSGTVVADAERKEVLQKGLFQLGATSFGDFITVDLVTCTDVWLPFDLKGRPQPEIYAVNAPRLGVALHELSEALESETDPDDPTYFAKPTTTGAENFFDSDGKTSDVWGSFEVPSRYDVFRHAPGFGRIGYRRSADGNVQYVPVRNPRGEVLGYLWASDAENAASFEPRDVGDDATYRIGLTWLERLRSAYDRGLLPSDALAELSALHGEKGAGQVAPASESRTTALAVLREDAAGR